MEKAYYDQQSLLETKKHFHRALVFFVIALVLLLAIPVATIFIQTRETKFYFILFGSILTVFDFIAVLFINFVYIRPYRAFLRFLKESENRNKEKLNGVLLEISDSPSTYLCNEFFALYFLVDAKRVRLYVLSEQRGDFETGKSYALTASQGIVLSMEVEE